VFFQPSRLFHLRDICLAPPMDTAAELVALRAMMETRISELEAHFGSMKLAMPRMDDRLASLEKILDASAKDGTGAVEALGRVEASTACIEGRCSVLEGRVGFLEQGADIAAKAANRLQDLEQYLDVLQVQSDVIQRQLAQLVEAVRPASSGGAGDQSACALLESSEADGYGRSPKPKHCEAFFTPMPKSGGVECIAALEQLRAKLKMVSGDFASGLDKSMGTEDVRTDALPTQPIGSPMSPFPPRLPRTSKASVPGSPESANRTLLGRAQSVPSFVVENFQKDLKLPLPTRDSTSSGRDRSGAVSPSPVVSRPASVPASPMAAQGHMASRSPSGSPAGLEESFMSHVVAECRYPNIAEAEEIAELREKNKVLRAENVDIRHRVLRQQQRQEEQCHQQPKQQQQQQPQSQPVLTQASQQKPATMQSQRMPISRQGSGILTINRQSPTIVPRTPVLQSVRGVASTAANPQVVRQVSGGTQYVIRR